MESFNSKVLLFGEYTVLQRSMALVMPCDLYSGQLNFYDSAHNKTFAVQSNEYLKRFSAFVASHMDEEFVLEVKRFETELANGLFFQSNIPQGYGLGSSGALVVAIFLRYLKKAKYIKDDLKGMTFTKMERLKDSLGKLESFFHGVSSGLDPLSIILNKPLLFKGKEGIETTDLPSRMEDGKNVIFLLDTRMKRNTSVLMPKFHSLLEDKKFNKKLKKVLVNQNDEAIRNFLDNRPNSLYFNLQQISSFQLCEMQDFIPESLRPSVQKGIDTGDYFLKLCGAGGGGFMLGFTQDWAKAVEELAAYDIKEIYRY